MKKLKKYRFKYFEPVEKGNLLELNADLLESEYGPGRYTGTGREKLFLRRFNTGDLYKIMEKVGLIKHLKKIGFNNLIINIDIDESLINYFKLYYKEISSDNLLIDLRLTESKFIPDKKFFNNIHETVIFDMIVIEWLSVTNPEKAFPIDRPQLPGQIKPGLGALNYCFKMMSIVAEKVFKDGFLDIPDHMHCSIMYSKKFKFFNPLHDAILKAILRDLKGYSLSDISWGMITGSIIEEHNNLPQEFDPSEQVFYISDRLRSYFHSKKYKSTFKKNYKRKKYRFEYDRMVKKRDELLKNYNIAEL